MLKSILLILVTQSALPGAVKLTTSAVPAHLDGKDLQSILVGLQSGGVGLLANPPWHGPRDIWQPYELTDMGRKWGEYQAALARDLRSGSRKGQLKVLVVTAVADSQREVLLWEDSVQRLAATSSDLDDVFHWALFHHDNTTEWWANSTLFTNPISNGEKLVVFNHVGPGCKLQNWGLLPQELTDQYDYIWLVDSDLRLDFFRWDLYRAVLTTLRPVVSQPSVLPPFGGGQSSVVKYLNIHAACNEGFPVAMELPRSEVQAPLLSAKIWPAVRARVRNGPGTTDWFTDSFWDAIAYQAKYDAECGQVGPVLVNAAPVWHQAWKTLTTSHRSEPGKCPAWKHSETNRRGISPDEHEEMKAGLMSLGCQPNSPKLLSHFQEIFSEQAHRGERLCQPDRGSCRKWIDGGGANRSSPYTCFPNAPEFARTEFAKRGMVTANDSEHLLGGLHVGIYTGLP